MADNLTPMPVKTKAAGDVEIDIGQYLGVAAGAGNAIHVQPGTGATFEVVGDAAENAPVAGNPVLTAGRYDATPRTLGDGDVGAIALDPDGAVHIADGGNTITVDGSVGITGSVDTELPAAAALTDDFANPTAPAVGAFLMVWDSTTWDRAPGTSADGLLVNLGTNNDVDTELPAAAALADDVANPTVPAVGAFMMGWDSGNTNWNRAEVDDAGHWQVDVLTGGGSDTPTNPATEDVTSAALAAGSSVDLDSTDVGATTLKVAQIDITASVPWKARVMTVADAVETVHTVLFGPANTTLPWKPPHRDYIQQGAAGAGFDGFRVEMTNMDNLDAADVYCTYYTEE